MYWYGGPHLGGLVMGLSFLLFWGLVAVAIFAIVRYGLKGGRRPSGPFPGYAGQRPYYGPAAPPPGPAGPAGPFGISPEQILANRFASGEIDENEFRQRMSVLRAEAGPAGTQSSGTQSSGTQDAGTPDPGEPA